MKVKKPSSARVSNEIQALGLKKESDYKSTVEGENTLNAFGLVLKREGRESGLHHYLRIERKCGRKLPQRTSVCGEPDHWQVVIWFGVWR